MSSQTPSDGVIKTTLPNGLTVLLKEDHSSPVVAINVWFRVGSVNELEEENGLAHFQEHMVFKGTERHGVGEIANIVKSAGGNLNAATSYSYTMYYVVLPSDAFSLGLDVQADAMMNSTFDQAEFDKERLVVMDEARMYDDTPDSYTFYRTMELGFNVHNYRRPIAGYADIVSKFTRDQLVGFYDRYYRPGNAVLCVVGDVNADDAMKEIERVYGVWRNGAVDVNQSPAEPPQDGFRFKALRGPMDHAYFSLGFHVPSILDADYPALEMLATVLGMGRSSRLHRRIVDDKQLATTARASLLAEKWPGFFMIFVSTPFNKWANARDAIADELATLQEMPVTEEELLKGRRLIEKAMYAELETVEGQASTMGYYEVLGDYRLADEHREALRNVTPEQVMYVAQKYFRVDNCSMVSYIPESVGEPDPDEDNVSGALATRLSPEKVSAAPAAATLTPGPARIHKTDRSTASVEMHRLDNGLRVLVKRRSSVPTVSMATLYDGGTRLEPPGQSGLSTLGSRVLLKGTESFDTDQIVSTIEGLGGSIESFSSFDLTGVYMSILSEHLGEALPVYRDVVRRPAFSDEEVEKVKRKLLEELAKRHDHPIHYSMDELFAKVFGDHPYAHPFVGDESQVARLTPGNCRSWYGNIVVPDNMTMVFVGDIDVDRAIEVASDVYGDLQSAAAPTSGANGITAAPGVHELHRTNLRQAVGLVGFLAPPMMTDDAIALRVLNGVMTGLGGRLFVELRDKRSLGYMTGSSLLALKDRSIFYGYANPGPDGVQEALDVILNELEKVAKENVSDEELDRSKQWIAGSQIMQLQRNTSQALEYGTYEVLGFGYGVVDRAQERIESVTADQIREAAARVFDRDEAVQIKLMPELEAAAD